MKANKGFLEHCYNSHHSFKRARGIVNIEQELRKTECKYKFQSKEKFNGKPYCTCHNELCEDISFACDKNCQIFEDYKNFKREQNRRIELEDYFIELEKANKELKDYITQDLQPYTKKQVEQLETNLKNLDYLNKELTDRNIELTEDLRKAQTENLIMKKKIAFIQKYLNENIKYRTYPHGYDYTMKSRPLVPIKKILEEE